MDVAVGLSTGRIAFLGDACDEDGNVVLILARMELERIVEDRFEDPSSARAHHLYHAFSAENDPILIAQIW